MRLGFFLLNNFSMMSVVAAIEPLRSANRLLDAEAYTWCHFSLDGNPVTASNGMQLAVDGSMATSPPLDCLFVCCGMDVHPPQRSQINAALHRVRHRVTKMGALSTGTFILARAGLVGHLRCTVHWETMSAFQQEFPSTRVENRLFVIDQGLYTCSGGLASADMILHIIGEEHGSRIARAVGNQFQVDRIRDSDEAQRSGTLDRLVNFPDPLQKAVSIILENLEQPISVAELAKRAGVRVRSLERLFQRWLQCSPRAFYRERRLEKAHELLLHTSLPLIDIALLTGFGSHSQFSSTYRRHFGRPPRATRCSLWPTSQRRLASGTAATAFSEHESISVVTGHADKR